MESITDVNNKSIQEKTTAIQRIFEAQRLFFDNGNTRNYTFRRNALISLKKSIKKYEKALIDAMYADYKKPATEAYIGDIGVVLAELEFAIRHLKYWMEERRTSTPLTLYPASSKIIYEPKGVVVIFAPWNYPFNLAISPLIGAIAAGNCVILKPAHETPCTAEITTQIISEAFLPEHVITVMGDGREIGHLLLDNLVFNHIFFTGSASTGKWIMEKAAKNLTPVTLELGGKCPVIVDNSARINTITKRIVWGKFFNAGQTCLAVDYILVHKDVKDKLIAQLIKEIQTIYGNNAELSPDYCRIVNQERTEKIVNLMDGQDILYGGKYNIEECYIEPTVLDVNNMDSRIMQEEIFGPLLPIVTWKDESEVIEIVRKNRYPLACYVFSEHKKFINFIHQNIEFGGGCVNNVLVHYANTNVGFGGVMTSGFGKYHGPHSFETFSNAKPVLSSFSLADLHIWYPPYSDTKLKVIKKVLG